MLPHLLLFGAVAAATWFAVLALWPRMLLGVFRRALLRRGFGDGPIPVNTLRTQPAEFFADPLHLPAGAPRVARAGVNRDTLLSAGWLDLTGGPQVLHVPAMGERYYAVQITDPARNTNVAYVGTRATGGGEGSYLLTGPDWAGAVPAGLVHVALPIRRALLIGRVLVRDEQDLPAAHALSTTMRLTPLT